MDSNLNIFLNALREAINNDPNQFNRAKTDPMYRNFRKEVDALLEEMIKEKRTIAEKEFRDLEYSAKKMAKWFDSEFCSSSLNEYRQVCKNIADSLDKFKTQNYLEYINAMQMVEIINNRLMSLKQTIKNNLNDSEGRLKQIPENIKTIKNQKNEANKKYSEANKKYSEVKNKKFSEENKKYSDNIYKFFLSICYYILGTQFRFIALILDSFEASLPELVGMIFTIIFAIIMIFIVLGGILGIPLALFYAYKIKNDFGLKKDDKKIFESEKESEKEQLERQMKNIESEMMNLESKIEKLESETKQLKQSIAIARLSL